MSRHDPPGCAYTDQDVLTFTVLLGSDEKARQLIADLQGLSLRTAFSYRDFRFPARVLLVYGFPANEIALTIAHLCETVQRLGGESSMLNRIAVQICQMKTQGVVRTVRVHVT